jgi:SAM-dependent methyltransferase
MNASIDRIRDDFDRIALLAESHGDVGDAYQNYLLSHLPSRCENALEIGCGTGKFTRLLASRAQSVTAIDLSPQMIRLARQESANYSNIEYVLDDVMRRTLPVESYDCVVSIATLHHLPPEQALLKIKAALKPNGTLIIHDLVRDDGFFDRLVSMLAYPSSIARRYWKTGRVRTPQKVRKAWAEHGRGEVYLTVNEVRKICEQYLPEAHIKRHLLWRYTVVWRKPSAG